MRRIAAGAALVPVWENELGGLTFQLGDDRYLKWIDHDEATLARGERGHFEIDLAAEAARLDWAGRFSVVPQVLDQGSDAAGQWLLTHAIAGESAVAPRWVADPRRAAEGIGRGLRLLHDALPLAECPFSWSVEERIEAFEARLGRVGPGEWSPEYRHLSAADVRAMLADAPPLDAVVCHGDACAPNTLLAADGSVAGHVDLGSLGVADRWADLAVAAWSTEWDYGPGYEAALLEGYGIEPDAERIRYYRLLWDVS